MARASGSRSAPPQKLPFTIKTAASRLRPLRGQSVCVAQTTQGAEHVQSACLGTLSWTTLSCSSAKVIWWLPQDCHQTVPGLFSHCYIGGEMTWVNLEQEVLMSKLTDLRSLDCRCLACSSARSLHTSPQHLVANRRPFLPTAEAFHHPL